MSDCDFYPSLHRYFRNETELAHAGCMSRTRLADCLNGKKNFTRSEKKAISANIVVKTLRKTPINEVELDRAFKAWHGQFDELYRRKDK